MCPLAGEIFNLGNIDTRPNSTQIPWGKYVLFYHRWVTKNEARMVLTPDLDAILKDVPQQMPEEDLPEEPRVTRVDRKDRPASESGKDFRGMISIKDRERKRFPVIYGSLSRCCMLLLYYRFIMILAQAARKGLESGTHWQCGHGRTSGPSHSHVWAPGGFVAWC